MMPVTSWSTTAANNNAAPPNGAPEGMAPSGVNDTIRQIMADIARDAQINAVKKLNSVSGTDTITADMDPELASYAAGMMVVLTPANTNSGAVTLAIDGLTALDILKADGDALVAGDLVAGVPAFLILDSGADDFYLLNPQSLSVGSISATGVTISTESVFYGGAAVKSADTSRNTTTTNTDDPHLQISIPATGTYKFTLQLFIQNTTTITQGFKFTLATTGTITSTIHDAIFSSFGGTAGVSTAYGSASPLSQGFANANIDFATYTGVMVLTGAQTLKVQWAQNSSSANNTTLKAGSNLLLQRLAG